MKLTAAGKKIARMLYVRIHDALYELKVDTAASHRTAPGCRLLNDSDASLLEANFKPDKVAEFLGRLPDSAGFICEAEGGMIAGYAWVSAKKRDNEGESPFFYRIVPENGDLYIFDVFVRPEYRGQGVATRLMKSVVSYARERGFKRCFTLHDERNNAMINVSEKIGFRRIGTLTFRRIGLWVTRDTTALQARG